GIARSCWPARPCTSERLGHRHRVLRWNARVRDHACEARAPPRGARGLLHRDRELQVSPRGAWPRGRARRRRRRLTDTTATTELECSSTVSLALVVGLGQSSRPFLTETC